ncbi:nuclear transport factor 2 family protein [Acerihabitans sp. TG2]|uniref:nuclear transport factor 2 family protein n=1 Tax=Acerihabitans sp. TG2 TaxID=3096008 RepID=UPI002B233260|nr:nuclear transport factor 2 family protein [Acerihabitans sp. TG2]MEA9391268.1 nuclear transport factor 2 family protein [Acerihabitans sp. TG2]
MIDTHSVAAPISAIIEQLTNVYRQLDESHLAILPEIYHAEVVFINPISQRSGIDALVNYYSQLLTKMNYFHLDIHKSLIVGDEATLFWRMRYSHPACDDGEALELEGISHIKIADQRILYQQDYYDLGAMIYEHVPLLGNAIKALKNRLKR